MTPFEKLLLFLVSGWRVELALLTKLAVILLLLLYLIFTFVVIRQVQLMNRTVSGLMNRPLLWMAWGLVGLAAAALIFIIIYL
jgi:hypothetical protein